MSFEGYYEYICERKHRFSCDVYSDSDDSNCPHCGGKKAFSHLVDQTNGYEVDNPGTYPAGVRIVGFEDTWSKDHYGNKYATKRDLVEPCADEWKKIP